MANNKETRFFIVSSTDQPKKNGLYEITRYKGPNAGLVRRATFGEATTRPAGNRIDAFVPVAALSADAEIPHPKFGRARFTPIEISRD